MAIPFHPSSGPSMIKCPIHSCPTNLQRTVLGTLWDGVRSHLKVVHQLGAPLAEVLVQQAKVEHGV